MNQINRLFEKCSKLGAKVKRILIFFVGQLLCSFYVLRFGFYKSRGRIYFHIQAGGPFSQLFRQFFNLELWEIGKDLRWLQGNLGRERVPETVLEEYCNEDLGGYGCLIDKDDRYKVIHAQKGLILQPLMSYLDNCSSKMLAVEIGCGAGDVLAFLAEKYQGIDFLGVDFSIKNAEILYGNSYPNLKFKSGYALDLFQSDSFPSSIEIIYFSSVAIFFTPIEFLEYLKVFRMRGVKKIFLSEPIWWTNRLPMDKSYHLGGHHWVHPYVEYLKGQGFNVQSQKLIPYLREEKLRCDLSVLLIEASLEP